jgi:polyhydroxybutyrate depolymerase
MIPLNRLRAFTLLCVISAIQTVSAGQYVKKEAVIGEEIREYYVYTPDSLKGKTKRPAIIAFHGYKSDANGFRWLIAPDKWADKHGFVMIYPNAVNKSWNAGKGMGSQNKTTDDERFAAELPSLIIERHNIAANKIYTMGFSNGAQMAAKLICHQSVQIAGAAMVAQSLNEEYCHPAYKVPVVVMHGMADPAAPYKGGGKFKVRSHQQTVDFFRNWYEIKAEKKTVKGDSSFKCSEYKDGKANTSVIGCSMFKDGHQWPGSQDFLVKQLGTTNKKLIANDFIMQFFKRFSGTPPYMGETVLAAKTDKSASPKKAAVKSTSDKAPAKTSAKPAAKGTPSKQAKPAAKSTSKGKPEAKKTSAEGKPTSKAAAKPNAKDAKKPVAKSSSNGKPASKS